MLSLKDVPCLGWVDTLCHIVYTYVHFESTNWDHKFCRKWYTLCFQSMQVSPGLTTVNSEPVRSGTCEGAFDSQRQCESNGVTYVELRGGVAELCQFLCLDGSL